MVAICNARKYVTGLPLSVDGNPMDGKFELVLITNIVSTKLICTEYSCNNSKPASPNTGPKISIKKAPTVAWVNKVKILFFQGGQYF